MKGIRKACQLMERCDCYGRNVQELVRKCDIESSERCEMY